MVITQKLYFLSCVIFEGYNIILLITSLLKNQLIFQNTRQCY